MHRRRATKATTKSTTTEKVAKAPSDLHSTVFAENWNKFILSDASYKIPNKDPTGSVHIRATVLLMPRLGAFPLFIAGGSD
jgi:hypothetical protein